MRRKKLQHYIFEYLCWGFFFFKHCNIALDRNYEGSVFLHSVNRGHGNI